MKVVGGTVVTGTPLKNASVAVVVMHGRDQDPQWMLDNLVAELHLPRAAFILPKGTVRTLSRP